MGTLNIIATNIKPPHYVVNDVDSLVLPFLHSFCTNLSEPKPPTRRFSLRNTNIDLKNIEPCQVIQKHSSSSSLFT